MLKTLDKRSKKATDRKRRRESAEKYSSLAREFDRLRDDHHRTRSFSSNVIRKVIRKQMEEIQMVANQAMVNGNQWQRKMSIVEETNSSTIDRQPRRQARAERNEL